MFTILSFYFYYHLIFNMYASFLKISMFILKIKINRDSTKIMKKYTSIKYINYMTELSSSQNKKISEEKLVLSGIPDVHTQKKTFWLPDRSD